MAERWRRVPGWPGIEASDRAGVRTVPRTLSDGRETSGAVLAQRPDKDGYPTVRCGRRTARVHTLVALAWLGPPEVRHMNDDRSDCTPGNLAWGSRRDNERDKKREAGKENRTGTRPSLRCDASGT